MKRMEPELNLITDSSLRASVKAALQMAPSYFWTISSSTTGKTHPSDERCEGGRVLHTKRVTRLAYEIARVVNMDEVECDILVAAALVHDLVANGPDDEPMPNNWLLHDVGLRTHLKGLEVGCAEEVWNEVLLTAEMHMGRWASSPAIQPYPGSLGYLLHLADVIASRSWVAIEPIDFTLIGPAKGITTEKPRNNIDSLLMQVQAKIARLECLAESWRKAWKHEHDMRIVFEDRLKAAEKLLEAARKEG